MANENIILWLEKILEDYENNPNKTTHQKRAISNGIYSIKNYDKEIKSKKDAIKIKGIGKSLSEKIEVIIKTGEYPLEKTTKKLEHTEKKQKAEDLFLIKTNLMKITGIGDKRAETYIKLGIRNHKELLDKVQKKEIKVTDHILIGLKYYDDFNERIPIKEVDKFNILFKSIFDNMGLTYEICGSYRRKKQNCGDIDILVTHKSFISNEELKKSKIMFKILEEMKNVNILIPDGNITPDAIKKFMGTCKLPEKDSKARRLDIRLALYESYPTSLMYFTGSKDFNLKMRNKAIELGYMLNEYGLYKDKQPFEINNEEDIFKKLDEKYIKPELR